MTQLNNSWSEDALIADAKSGMFVDASKVKSINHKGSYYQVAGPLNVPLSLRGNRLWYNQELRLQGWN
ncbi:hypothetical protein D1632_06050 [Chryseobacterium nematophagum]|uniref:Uncharacterized protein n=1 Tax=Chryseobacterium nematophagum TaxID=2305228 RepID=A0A3M7LAI6_9FLAO|nr:hypothetical protein D1632_06050 [Chryseobacterium nematophagum]